MDIPFFPRGGGRGLHVFEEGRDRWLYLLGGGGLYFGLSLLKELIESLISEGREGTGPRDPAEVDASILVEIGQITRFFQFSLERGQIGGKKTLTREYNIFILLIIS